MFSFEKMCFYFRKTCFINRVEPETKAGIGPGFCILGFGTGTQGISSYFWVPELEPPASGSLFCKGWELAIPAPRNWERSQNHGAGLSNGAGAKRAIKMGAGSPQEQPSSQMES